MGVDGGGGEHSVVLDPLKSVRLTIKWRCNRLPKQLRVCKQVQSDQPPALILSASEIRRSHVHKHSIMHKMTHSYTDACPRKINIGSNLRPNNIGGCMKLCSSGLFDFEMDETVNSARCL